MVCSEATTDWKRFCVAPSEARAPMTWLSAASIEASALRALSAVVHVDGADGRAGLRDRVRSSAQARHRRAAEVIDVTSFGAT